MSKEAMKLALEALQECRRDPRLKYEHPIYDKAIKALEEALTSEQEQRSNEQLGEPVAGYFYTKDNGCYIECDPKHQGEKGVVPLYTTPQPKQEQDEPVGDVTCWTIKGNLKNHDFDYYGNLPDGTHLLYTTPQPKQEQGEPTRHELQAKGKHPAPCARFCEANAFEIKIKNLKGDIERAILAERGACLKVCEEQAVTAYWEGADVCVEEIKKRGLKI
jgi:hypothetical protein